MQRWSLKSLIRECTPLALLVSWSITSAGCAIFKGSPDYRTATLLPKQVVRGIDTTYSPSARAQHTAIWTGRGMFVWGGELQTDTNENPTGGSFYFPGTGIWRNIPLAEGEPVNRLFHSAIWTGKSVIIWGGYNPRTDKDTDGGFIFNEESQEWYYTGVSRFTPSARSGHSAVWTGQQVIIWGGFGNNRFRSDGAIYDPAADRWYPLPGTPLGQDFARAYHTAVWTGKRMLIFGGKNERGAMSKGLAYDPAKRQWRRITQSGEPSPRTGHTATWTKAGMIVWGGIDLNGRIKGDGAIYRPSNRTWMQLPATKNSPSPRNLHAAAYTGQNLVIVGGRDLKGALGDVKIYNLRQNRWYTLVLPSQFQEPRYYHSALWTGDGLVVWGGKTTDGSGSDNWISSGSNYTVTR